MEKLKTLLIANRGEIAVRITKTARYEPKPNEQQRNKCKNMSNTITVRLEFVSSPYTLQPIPPPAMSQLPTRQFS